MELLKNMKTNTKNLRINPLRDWRESADFQGNPQISADGSA